MTSNFMNSKNICLLIVVALFVPTMIQSRTNVVVFSEQVILERTAQGQGILKDISKFEDKIIACLEQERVHVIEREKDVALLQHEHEERMARIQVDGTILTGVQKKSLNEELQALMVAQSELIELQKQFYHKAQQVKDRIDRRYLDATSRFYKKIFQKSAALYGWDIVLPRNSLDMTMFASDAVDITSIILEKFKKQREVQLKKFTTTAEIKSLFADLDLIYIDANKICSTCKSALELSMKQYYQQNVVAIGHLLQLYGDAISQKQRAPITVAWVSDKVGWGVFAAKNILSGEFIQEYTGIIEVQIPGVFFDSTYSWKLFQPKGTRLLLVDSMKEGNEMRFVNHSNHPNVVSRIFIGHDQQYHVCYIAQGFIKEGEQLLVSYGREYWNERCCLEEMMLD